MGLTAGIVAGQGGNGANSDGYDNGSAQNETLQRPVFNGWQVHWTRAANVAGTYGREALDVPPTPVPPQGQGAAAEVYTEHVPGNHRAGAGDEVAYESDVPTVSYTALGEIVAAYPWPINEAFAVVDCESRWDPLAVSWNGSSYGLFQINAIHFWRWPNAWNEWDNPEVNTRWAWELHQESGWGIWSCR